MGGRNLSLLIRRVIRFAAFSSSSIFTSFRKFLLSTAYVPPVFLPPLIFFCWLLIMVLLTPMVIKITYLFYGLLFTFHILFSILEESIHSFFLFVCMFVEKRTGRVILFSTFKRKKKFPDIEQWFPICIKRKKSRIS